jgi:hypothetical protein
MPNVSEFGWDPNRQMATGAPVAPGDPSSSAGFAYQRSPEEIQSLLDLMGADQPVASTFPGGGGGGPEGSPMADPANWFMTRGDLESPLQYMASMGSGTSPYVGGSWRPSDKGGYFTLSQLYRGQNLPDVFAYGSNLPSTNNWRLTVPYGGHPGTILRNGQLIRPGPKAARGHMISHTGSGVRVAAEDPGGTWNMPVPPGAALSGNNAFAAQYWPGGDIFNFMGPVGGV